jgi:CheY-like chemotaxis protein
MPTVLIVDDEWIVAHYIEVALARLDCRCVVVRSAAQALAAVTGERPSLVIMDVSLGCEDGIELSRRIRESADVPVVFLTAQSDEATIRRALATRPAGYLVKPVDGSALLRLAERLLTGPPAQAGRIPP